MADRIKSFPIEQIKDADDGKAESEEHLLASAILRLNGNILGVVLGVVVGLVIFVATNWLVIKGGQDVGAHLNLLGQFYIGYSVSFVGSLIGTIYGFLTGYVTGFLTAWIYNWIIVLKKPN